MTPEAVFIWTVTDLIVCVAVVILMLFITCLVAWLIGRDLLDRWRNRGRRRRRPAYPPETHDT